MKRTRKRVSVRSGSVLKAALLLLLGAAALDASGIALADDPPGSPPPAIEEEANEPPPLAAHQPNTLYGDEDAIPFNQLSGAEQAGVEAAGAKTTYPGTVQEGYSAISHRAAEAAALAKAAHQSGTNGLDEVGVEP
jgi:hypothetical protein